MIVQFFKSNILLDFMYLKRKLEVYIQFFNVDLYVTLILNSLDALKKLLILQKVYQCLDIFINTQLHTYKV